MLIPTNEEQNFRVSSARLKKSVNELSLGAFVFSNPCNPTGHVIFGDEFKGYTDTARETGCSIIFDEFYSHYIYNRDGSVASGPVSATEYVEDVNKDPILAIDGLTKNYRYPG